MRRGILIFSTVALMAASTTFFVGCGTTNANSDTTAETANAAELNGEATAPDAAKEEKPGALSRMARAVGLAKEPEIYTLEEGTPIKVRTTSTLSTKSTTSGETFVASLAEPIVVGDKVLAPRGAEVVGRVVNADPGGRVKGVASISLTLASLELANGEDVSIDTTNVGRSARATKKKDAAKIGIGSGIGAAIGAIAGGGKGAAIGAAAGGGAGTGVVLATKGDPAVVPAESLLTFRTQAPVRVQF